MTTIRERAVRALEAWTKSWGNTQGERLYDERLIAAIAAEFGWRPIETAPKDGTFILIRLESGHVLIAQYCQDGYWRKDVGDPSKWKPVAWMEAPE